VEGEEALEEEEEEVEEVEGEEEEEVIVGILSDSTTKMVRTTICTDLLKTILL